MGVGDGDGGGDDDGGGGSFPQGIIKRDEIVFRAARQQGIPILMVTSGGYQRKTARIIADSILNLHWMGLLASGTTDQAGPLTAPGVAGEEKS